MKLAATQPSEIGTLQGSIIQEASTPEGVAYLPKTVRPNAQWRYKAHPSRWDWSEDYGWYPILGRWHMDNGLDGVSITAKGYQGLGNARQRNMTRGWMIIELGDHRLGKFAQYLQGFPTTKGRPHYISIFHSPDVEGKIVEWLFDTASYKEFLNLIVEAGVIPPMREMIKRGKVRNQQRVTTKLEQDMFESPKNPMIRVRYEREARKLAGMRGENIQSAVEEAHLVARQAMEKGKTDDQQDRQDQQKLAVLAQEAGGTSAAAVICPGCDRSFPSQASMDGHKPHCKGKAS